MLHDEAEMASAMRDVRNDPDLRRSLVASGLETIRARHTCAHRVDDLMAVLAVISGANQRSVAASPSAKDVA